MRLSFSLSSTLVRGLIAVFALPLIFSIRGWADDGREIMEALPVAKAWLAQIDAGQYEQSYITGGEALHDKIPEKKWLQILTTIRTPIGQVTSRKQTGQTYEPDGFEGVSGEFVTFSFDTSFEKLPSEVEHVILKREDGEWRAVGYDFGPRDAGDMTQSPDTTPTTTTTTQEHATPTPQTTR